MAWPYFGEAAGSVQEGLCAARLLVPWKQWLCHKDVHDVHQALVPLHRKRLQCFLCRLKVRLKALAELIYFSQKDKSVSESEFF